MGASQTPVLLIGGYGVTGRKVAAQLRARHPDLPLTIAGRDFKKAELMARELGGADAFEVDLEAGHPDLGLPHGAFSAMAVLVKDETLDTIRFAERHGVGYLNVTNGVFESAGEFVQGISAVREVPVVIASQWFCGAVLFSTLALTKALSSVSKIEIGIVIDRGGASGGPAATADFERIFRSCPSVMVRDAGRYRWVSGDAARGRFAGVGGLEQDATVSVSTDCLTLGAATDARDIRVLEIFGQSFTGSQGGGAADEISITVEGRTPSGALRRIRQDIVALSAATTSLTAINIAMLLGRMAGCAGEGLAPGFYTPDRVIDADTAVARMQAAGVRFLDPVEAVTG
jgi:hypothetical protein